MEARCPQRDRVPHGLGRFEWRIKMIARATSGDVAYIPKKCRSNALIGCAQHINPADTDVEIIILRSVDWDVSVSHTSNLIWFDKPQRNASLAATRRPQIKDIRAWRIIRHGIHQFVQIFCVQHPAHCGQVLVWFASQEIQASVMKGG